jgi:hypothetical protein
MEGIEHGKNLIESVLVRSLPKRRSHDRAACERFTRQVSTETVVRGLSGL